MFTFMKEILDKFLSFLLQILPTSPFAPLIDNLEQLPYLGYINYFVPVGTCIKIGEAWLCCYRTLLSLECSSALDKTD